MKYQINMKKNLKVKINKSRFYYKIKIQKIIKTYKFKYNLQNKKLYNKHKQNKIIKNKLVISRQNQRV